ncbi:NUDIX domain-containing protein [Nocardia sp. NBC_01388]|uniref:NUDIX domain-containing protein n=1 Tax=Nocardia sp. NBC_01388 TaxID=2903596 RepID=UPI0032438B6D
MSNVEPPLYERDPAEYRRHLAEGNRTQPRKRVGADALVFDQAGRILLVDPSYKPQWDIPGGMAEANEPPVDAVCRELREELGLDLTGRALPLLCLDWVAPHGVWDDSLMVIFDGGELTTEQISSLHITDEELVAFEFCTLDQAQQRLRPYWDRVDAALRAHENGRTAYLHDGRARQ